MGVQYTPAMPGLRRPRRICGARNVATILILENREVADQQAHCRQITGRRQKREFCTNPPRRVAGFRKRRISTTLSFASTSRVHNRRNQNSGSEVRCKTPCQQTVILDAKLYGTTTTAFNPAVMRSQFATTSGRRRGASSQCVPTRSVGTRNGFCPLPSPLSPTLYLRPLPMKLPPEGARWLISLRWLACAAVVAVTWLTSSMLHVVADPRPLYVIAAAMIGYNLLFYRGPAPHVGRRGERRAEHLSPGAAWIWFR